LVDAHLPLRLCKFFTDSTGANSVHVFWLPAGDETEDEEITRYADENDLIVVTKNADFVTSQILKNEPKRLLVFKVGNISNQALLDLVASRFHEIKELFAQQGVKTVLLRRAGPLEFY
jgi:predicted nuclease of predicted toxin-antitoxin system